ncbi:hypothetical protein Curi_c01650 [Gottschalkia acidurici 9a]|uniref:ECF transporter S component n=1 Tax=Gottschalkia acidurici (strain ATCC 7906 / DSM 604 / BCRC 14475 / CIP 104303 / KCTC 5404 / NCIMB 10678 / 9a) TaxID=1128398 RepID=K0AWX5_GOTA9|nr:ECF transporter S component [Gottschalkia acidurici]AFS77245.1 hypothetical protein Curi_c01650 [Gottschalkia acidurici 9a]
MSFKIKNLVLSGVLLGLTLLFSSIFHMTGIDGTIFSPMHLPVLLAGFIVGPFWGLLVGILAPVLNLIVSGMPSVPIVFVMMLELGIYGLLAGVFFNFLKITILPSLVFSMIIGRLAGGAFSYLLGQLFGFELGFTTFLKAAFIYAWPAIIIQIILVPILVKAYYRNSNISVRYI